MYLESSTLVVFVDVIPLSFSMLLWKALERVEGMGMSEMEVIWDSSDTLLLATTARLASSTSGSSTRAFTRRSCLRDRGRDPYRDWLKLWVDCAFILTELNNVVAD